MQLRRITALSLIVLGPTASVGPEREAAAQELRDPFQRSFSGVVNNDQETTSGAAWSDYDGDGDPDLFVSAWGNRNNFLYENRGDGSFRRVTQGLLVSDAGLSSGAAWADIDNDGDDDLIVTNQQGQDNFLYRNLGEGAFERLEGTVHQDRGDSYAAAWADFDLDGLVDLFVSNRSGEADFLYRNLGEGRFERVTTGAVAEAGGNTFTASWADYDGDGLPDLFVPNLEAESPNSLYRNLGDGDFQRVTEGPIAADAAISSKAAWGDYDNDGDLDLFVANGGTFSGNEEVPFLYRNDDGHLVRVMREPLVQHPFSGSDVAWFDMDNDGDLDLIVAAYREHNQVFRNDGEAGFVRMTEGWAASFGGYTDAVAVADYNRDGHLDLYLTHWESQNDLLLTNGGNDNHWIALRLEGTRSNRSAVGAVVRATALIGGRDVTQLRQVGLGRAGRGQDDREVHFGLGDAESVRSISIRWPSGEETELGPQEADRFLVVREGKGVVASTPPRAPAPTVSPAATVYQGFLSDGVHGALGAYRSLAARMSGPQSAAALAVAARYIFDSVDGDGGMALARAGLELAPTEPAIVFAAAELHRATGDRERARELYRRVLEVLPATEAPGVRDGQETPVNHPFDPVWMARVSARYTAGG